MKIAAMVRGYLAVPRPSDMIYAPADLAVELVAGLAERGHEVTFFGPQGTRIPGVEIVTLHLPPLVHNQKEFAELTDSTEKQMHYVPGLWDGKLACTMFSRAMKGRYDILHFHHPEIALGLAQFYRDIPVAYTMHDPFYPWYKELFGLYKSPNQHFISISDNQRRDASDLPFAATVYNGVDAKHFPFSEKHEDYLLFAGRIVPEKGVKEAIEVAQMTNHRLLIIGPVYEDNKEYFEQHIKPHLNDKILYLGFMEQEQLVKYYQKAKAFLMPIQWDEPFGLTMVESMACGTPIIALRRGSIPEVVVDGKTGFIVDCLQEMAMAIEKIDNINRRDCRKHAEKHFSISRMVDAYEAAFEAIIKKDTGLLSNKKLVRKKLQQLPSTLRTTFKKRSNPAAIDDRQKSVAP
jgi:glycosyltransferase involved in cell wall biosynthesis